MAQSQFSLSWGSYKRNLSNGLTNFQQNGDFVDMTLAADGHFVKVHQVILALASPYVKELLLSAPCPHPVLFLNNISYTSLCAILEYIYTGEVFVSVDNLVEIKMAAKELHIKGLENMSIPQQMTPDLEVAVTNCDQDNDLANGSNVSDLEGNMCYFEVTNQKDDEEETTHILPTKSLHDIDVKEQLTDTMEAVIDGSCADKTPQDSMDYSNREITIDYKSAEQNDVPFNPTLMQYTVSNQGSLQMILNRYLYYLKHSNRDNTQQWRCVDYLSGVKCPAYILTKNGAVNLRVSAHTHPFHDKKILKKVRAGAVYSAIGEARLMGQNIKNRNSSELIQESSE